MARFLLVIMVLAAIELSGQAEVYVCGNFNNWEHDAKKEHLYPLTEQKDGSYSGEFNIPALDKDLKFMLWDESLSFDGCGPALGTYYGNGDNAVSRLFSDHPWEERIYQGFRLAGTVEGPYPFEIKNWKGGTIKFTYKERMLSISAPGQPLAPKMPESVYVIGDFNNWSLPVADSEKGAVELKCGKWDRYKYLSYGMEGLTVPADSAKLAFYYVDPNENKDIFIVPKESGFIFEPWPYADELFYKFKLAHVFTLEEAKEKAFNPTNYKGNLLQFKSLLSFPDIREYQVEIRWADAPRFNSVENIETDSEDAPVFYYNMQGHRIEKPSKGTYIRVQGSDVKKILVR